MIRRLAARWRDLRTRRHRDFWDGCELPTFEWSEL